MQIMNGFQVLHKNKIMHRDVKLANIFLQDDKVIIGDFGFAKSGVDITTTKLGRFGICYNNRHTFDHGSRVAEFKW